MKTTTREYDGDGNLVRETVIETDEFHYAKGYNLGLVQRLEHIQTQASAVSAQTLAAAIDRRVSFAGRL